MTNRELDVVLATVHVRTDTDIVQAALEALKWNAGATGPRHHKQERVWLF